MSEQKHTPGPWVWDGPEGTGCDLRSAHGNVISHFSYEGMHFGRYNKEDAANARLIAAAPELLEALEGLMELERRGRLMPIGREWDAARAAIAKATGA